MIDKIKWCYNALPVLKEDNYRWSNSWTSIYDIGIYNGNKFTYKEYKKTEKAYVDLIVSIFKYVGAKKIKLIHFDHGITPPIAKYDKDGMLKKWYQRVSNHMSLSLDDIQYIVPLILRENIWGTLYHKRTRTYVRFGYDYYVYVNSPSFYHHSETDVYFNIDIARMVSQCGLFIEYDYLDERSRNYIENNVLPNI
jgi:hypothetical protein